MIDNTNIIVVTNTLSNNLISEKRRNNIINSFRKYNINILFNHGINRDINDKSIRHMFYVTLNNLNSIKKLDYEYVLLCDDDFLPIDNFLEELNKTIEALPKDWHILHLCPGFLWGRFYKDKNKIGKLNPEYNIQHFEYDISNRFFINLSYEKLSIINGWLGGPIALVIKKKYINEIILNYSNYENMNYNNDVILTHMYNKNTFVCANPMLGYENEEGGTTFN